MGCVGLDKEEELLGEPPRRGDSGGGVSQPISDTGEPRFTYGVASRMYLTGTTERERFPVRHGKEG